MSRSDSIPTHVRSRFYTYLHRRLDTGEVFYVGKGTRTRAASTSGRSEHWRRVAEKCGYSIEIAAPWPSEADAFEHERILIRVFREIGHRVVNATDGGEGPSGFIQSQETKAKRSRSLAAIRASDPGFDVRRIDALRTAKRSKDGLARHAAAMARHRSTDEARARQSEISKRMWADQEKRAAIAKSISAGRLKKLSHEEMSENSRKKFDDEVMREKLISNLLESNMRARKMVRCITTGELFESVASAAKKLGVSESCVICACKGRQKTTAGVELRYEHQHLQDKSL